MSIGSPSDRAEVDAEAGGASESASDGISIGGAIDPRRVVDEAVAWSNAGAMGKDGGRWACVE